MVITVTELLRKPFLNRSLENRIMVVSERKPRPLLQIMFVPDKDDDGMNKTKEFDPEVYDQIHWLTGCEIRHKFYCWPCLLFYKSKVEYWDTTKILRNLLEFSSLHESTEKHNRAIGSYKRFIFEYLMKKQVNLNLCVKENRKNVKLLIEAVYTMAENHPFPENNYFHALVTQDVCTKIMIKLGRNASYKYVEDAIELIEKYPTLLDDLVCSITHAFKLVVIKEVELSTYASLILSTHYSSSLKMQLSVVLRYISKGKVYERFLGFENATNLKSANVIYNIIKRTIETFKIQNKFLSYSFDGAVLEISKLIELNDLLQINYPQSYFVPCYFQRIPYIIQQSLSFHTIIEKFFHNLTAMEDYFQERSEPRKLFENLVKEKLKSCFKYHFINYVYFYRKHFIETLKYIADRYTSCNVEDVNKAKGLLQFLVESHTVYLIHILSPSFKHIIDFENNIKNRSSEMEFQSETAYTSIILNIQNESNCSIYFNSAMEDMNSANNDDYKSKQVKIDYNKDQWNIYNSVYITVMDHLAKEIKLRFSKVDDLAFCSLFNSYKINISQERSIYCYSKLDSTPQFNFSSQKLGIELLFQIEKKIFENINAYDLLQFYADTNSKTVFPCTNNLLEFALTMPFRPLMHEENSSKFQKIKNCTSFTKSNIKASDATVLYIESKYLHNMRTDSSFCNDVFEKLCEVNTALELKKHKTYEP